MPDVDSTISSIRASPSTEPPAPDGAPKATLLTLFWIFFQIGAMSFGGGLVAWVYREVVERRGWLHPPDMLSGVALAQVLPGVNVTNLSIYVGQRMRGVLGAATALVAVLTVPFFAIIALASVYSTIDAIPWAHNFMTGIAASAVGLVLSVTLKSIRTTIRGIAPFAVLAAIFVAVGVLRWPMVPVVAGIAPVSVAVAWWTGRSKRHA